MNQKYIAIFLAAIMVMSLLSFFVGSMMGNGNEAVSGEQQIAGFDSIPGDHVDHELNSITDGLEMSPAGLTSAQFLNLQVINGTPMVLLVGNTSSLDGIYGSKVEQMYSAEYGYEGAWFNLHRISPPIVAFQYYLYPDAYNGYYLLSRGNNMYNVVGTPMLLGERTSLEGVLDVLSGNEAPSDDFDRLIPHMNTDAQIQRVVKLTESTADEYYLDLRQLDNGQYERTVVYLNASDDLMNNVTMWAGNATERGLIYEISSEEDDITKVVITSDLSGLYSLSSEPVF